MAGLCSWRKGKTIAGPALTLQGNVLVLPGDIIVADDDGAIVVPVKLAPEVVKRASDKRGWEEYTRFKLGEGQDTRRYYEQPNR